MARQIRIEYDGAAYHVMARGNQGQGIFADDLDRQVWLETLAETCEKTGWRIHAYVLMGKESGVSKAIRRVKESHQVELNRFKQRLLQRLQEGSGNEKQA